MYYITYSLHELQWLRVPDRIQSHVFYLAAAFTVQLYPTLSAIYKLCIRWRGPYLVTNSTTGYNFKLKELKTRKDLKRLVHANRLRPLNELENAYRLIAKATDVVPFETKTPRRRCTIPVPAGEILATNCDMIVNTANSKLRHEGGQVKTIAEAAGDEFLQECWEFLVKARKTLPVAGILSTSGDLRPAVKAIINTV